MFVFCPLFNFSIYEIKYNENQLIIMDYSGAEYDKPILDHLAYCPRRH